MGTVSGPYVAVNGAQLAEGTRFTISDEGDAKVGIFVEQGTAPAATSPAVTPATANQLAALITQNADKPPDVLVSLLKPLLRTFPLGEEIGGPILEAFSGALSGLWDKLGGLTEAVGGVVNDLPKNQAAELQAKLDKLGV